jgi:hypothetical protein
MDFDFKELDGRWLHILTDFGINVTTKPGQPCPICGGKDRFHYTNKHGNGTYICRQCTPEGGSGFKLLTKVKNWDNQETGKQLRERYGSQGAKKVMYEKKEEPVADKFIRVPTVLIWDGKTLANKDKSYKFAYNWIWRNPDSSTFGYVARLEFSDKEAKKQKKMIWQIHHGYFESNPDNIGYHQVSMSPKPLFGYSIDGLTEEFKAVILCEGEKTCMALKKLIAAFATDYLILCCQGGAAQINSTDFKPVVDYIAEKLIPVYIWPDNDDTGFKHAEKLTEIFPEALTFSSEALEEIGCKYSPEHGDDAADLESLAERDLEMLIDCADNSAYENAIEAKEVIPETKKQALLKHVNPLGVYEGNYAFYPKSLRSIKVISANNLLQEATMLSIIDEDMLYKHFPKIDKETGATVGYNAKKAGVFLMNECHKRGLCDPERIRGIGVWKDGGRIVVNTGAALVVAGENFGYDDFKSNYTYAQPGLEKIKLGAVCSEDEIKLIKDIVYGFNWAKPYHAHLMLGALVQAPIASAFRWRAHVWLTGAQGTGKSTLQSFVIKPLLGNLGKSFAGATTAAGIRQSLKCDPLAVCFDEAEVRSEADVKRIKEIISLARISSSDEQSVVKGSASGNAVEYHCQSPFILSSIKPFLKEESDIARFALLELSQPGNSPEDAEAFKVLETSCMEIDEPFSERWIGSCIEALPRIEQNRIPVRSAMIALKLSPRTIDQYGQLIACAKAFKPDIDLADFNEMLDETKEHTAEAEPINELNRLLDHDIRVPSQYGDKTITIRKAIELIDRGQRGLTDDGFNSFDLEQRLTSKYRLKVQTGSLIIANKSSEIESILGYTDWNKLFKIIKGIIVSKTSTSFGAKLSESRYVKLPLSLIESSDSFGDSFSVQQTLMDTLLVNKPNIDAGF